MVILDAKTPEYEKHRADMYVTPEPKKDKRQAGKCLVRKVKCCRV